MSNNPLKGENAYQENKNIASYRRRLFVFLFALTFVALLSGFAWGQSLNSVLSKLDQTYYYPQKQGLKSLSARVQWEQLDVASGSGKFLRNTDFVYSWRSDSFGLGDFELAKGQEHIPKDRLRDMVQKIRPFRESIIPLTLKQKFSDFNGRVDKMDRGDLIIKLISKVDSKQNYKLLVDGKDWVIRKLRFQQAQTPEKVKGEFRYTRLDGKPAISESRTRFAISGKEYSEVTSYKYKKIAGIWWIYRIDQTFTQEDHILQTYVLRLTDFRPVLSSGR